MLLSEKIWKAGKLLAILLFVTVTLPAQNNPGNLPVQVKPPLTGSSGPLILYITGDGGMKKFSVNVISAFQQKGYPVVALNALKYFWNKKTPQQAATDAGNLIKYYQQQWNSNHGVILVGYSLGADVMPFIYNSLPAEIIQQVQQIVLLSPSRFTDMEVHVSDMLGKSNSKGKSVPAEINRIGDKPLLFVFGADEKDFKLSDITIGHYKHLVLPGGHTYEEDAAGVTEKILAALSR
ncbi:virulence factor [Chitinophaga nivalis]|uniref:Virulence factor n=1 Tax=Chitinophaga nivalis TaxID=2991709 RepID=A0ABT3IED9_9BACT|nr:virulence factor [Chitinophaga nivalis]MCW3467986.1 virulence factor [Chitinophaga nivalis]MCW3482323.1 virulence factor [Chitinophaga nivalis]